MDIVVHEKIDLVKLKKCRSKCNDPDLCSKLDGLLKYAKPLKKGDTVGINTISLKNEFVRAYPKNRPTIALLKKEIKPFLCIDNTFDFDIVNCHPTIFRNICKKNNIACPVLDDYVTHRDKWLAKGIEKDDVTMSLYGNRDPTKFDEIEKLRLENDIVCKHVLKIDEFKQVVEYAKLKKNNPKSESVISYILQSEEVKIVMRVIEVVKRKFPTLHLNSYEYDGCRWVVPSDVSKEDVLTTMNAVASDFDVRFIIKPPPPLLDWMNDESDGEAEEEEELTDTWAFDKIIAESQGFIRAWKSQIWGFDEFTGQWSIQTSSNPRIWMRLSKKVHSGNKYGTYTSKMLDTFRLCCMLPDDDEFFRTAELATVGKLLYKDGIWDIESNCVLEFSPNYLFTIKIDRPIPKHRNEDHIKKLYKIIFSDPHPNESIRNELIKGLSVALTGSNKKRKIWINLGTTGTGKSTLLNLLQNAYGGYVTTLKAQNFVLQKNADANEHCGWLTDLRYTRIAITSECPKNIRLDGNLLKTISGGDPVQSRKMYNNPESHNIQATIFMLANALSPIDPMDDAMRNRVSAIPWNVSFVKNETQDFSVNDYIKTNEAFDALFWILQEGYELFKTQGFCNVPEIDDYTKTFADEQDEFKQIFDEKFEVGGVGDMLLTDQVYHIFKPFSSSQSHVAQRLLTDYNVSKDRKRNAGKWDDKKMCFIGIKAKQTPDLFTDDI